MSFLQTALLCGVSGVVGGVVGALFVMWYVLSGSEGEGREQ